LAASAAIAPTTRSQLASSFREGYFLFKISLFVFKVDIICSDVNHNHSSGIEIVPKSGAFAGIKPAACCAFASVAIVAPIIPIIAAALFIVARRPDGFCATDDPFSNSPLPDLSVGIKFIGYGIIVCLFGNFVKKKAKKTFAEKTLVVIFSILLQKFHTPRT
jgi:hypothetical protein